MIKEITVEELYELRQKENSFKLIDVREEHEVAIATIGGSLIPLGDIEERWNDFVSDEDHVVVYCRSGKRSATAIEFIQNKTGKENLFNLKGGILEWADKIDSSITKY